MGFRMGTLAGNAWPANLEAGACVKERNHGASAGRVVFGGPGYGRPPTMTCRR
jgi:hypothetical protein